MAKRAKEYHGVFLQIQQILSEEHGSPKTHMDMLRDLRTEVDEIEDKLLSHFPMCEENFRNIDKLTDKETWERCPILRCSAFQEVVGQYKDLTAKLDVFEVVATGLRERTVEELKNTARGIDSMTQELKDMNREIINSLREANKQ